MRLAAVADRLEPLITGGLVATCAGLDAEAFYSTRSPAEFEQVRADRRAAYEYLPTDDGHWQRVVDAQRLPARRGGIDRPQLVSEPSRRSGCWGRCSGGGGATM